MIRVAIFTRLTSVALTAMVWLCGCGPPPQAPQTSASVPATPLVALWHAGQKETAIAKFVQLAQSASAQGQRLVLFTMTESEFNALNDPPRATTQSALIQLSREVREFAAALKNHADEQLIAGNIDGARQVLQSLKKLGSDNADPNMVRIGQFTGQAIEQLADQELAKLPQ